jgi:hypothetical protein
MRSVDIVNIAMHVQFCVFAFWHSRRLSAANFVRLGSACFYCSFCFSAFLVFLFKMPHLFRCLWVCVSCHFIFRTICLRALCMWIILFCIISFFLLGSLYSHRFLFFILLDHAFRVVRPSRVNCLHSIRSRCHWLPFHRFGSFNSDLLVIAVFVRLTPDDTISSTSMVFLLLGMFHHSLLCTFSADSSHSFISSFQFVDHFSV